MQERSTMLLPGAWNTVPGRESASGSNGHRIAFARLSCFEDMTALLGDSSYGKGSLFCGALLET